MRGIRVGEAKTLGPYSEGGATGSGANCEWAGHGKWTKKETQGGPDMSEEEARGKRDGGATDVSQAKQKIGILGEGAGDKRRKLEAKGGKEKEAELTKKEGQKEGLRESHEAATRGSGMSAMDDPQGEDPLAVLDFELTASQKELWCADLGKGRLRELKND